MGFGTGFFLISPTDHELVQILEALALDEAGELLGSHGLDVLLDDLEKIKK